MAFHKREEAVGDSTLFYFFSKNKIEVAVTSNDRQHVINELQKVIDDIQTTLSRFESTSMDGEMPEDYDKLLTILDDAIKQQREHTQTLLDDL